MHPYKPNENTSYNLKAFLKVTLDTPYFKKPNLSAENTSNLIA